jgi:transposase-like protein
MDKLSYRRHRFPSIIIQHAVWLYFRFGLSYRDVRILSQQTRSHCYSRRALFRPGNI